MHFPRVALLILLLSCGTGTVSAQAPLTAHERPSLVIAIVVDQMRYDYLTRNAAEFQGGLKRLLNEGAVLTSANYGAVPTVTAVGHSTYLSGATPSLSGIVGNGWYERSTGTMVQSVSDDDVMPLGGKTGASPKRLQVTTIGDELKSSGKGGRVYGVSLKNRGAILPAGRSADGAFWVEDGAFMSSTWYFPALPAWATDFNNTKIADKFAGMEWMGSKMPALPGKDLYAAIDSTPFADELVLDFALHVLKTQALGKGKLTDMLTVSFSAMDYLGHGSGPDTPQMHAMIMSIDDKIGLLLAAAEKQVGRGHILLVMTADHGVSPVPEELAAKHLPGGRYDAKVEKDAVEAALKTAFGEGNYIVGNSEAGFYLNRDPVPGKLISHGAMETVAAEALRRQPHVARVYTRTALESGQTGGDHIDQLVRNGFNGETSGDVIVIHDPNWLSGNRGTTHGAPYSYDTHVPLIFWGPKTLVRAGTYSTEVEMQDVASTLAVMLGVAAPSGATGRVLNEILP